jgi:ribose 5-phosphate isomerase B
MKVGIAADHAGAVYYRILIEAIKSKGIELIDFTGDKEFFDDYPDAAEVIGRGIMEKKIDRGILICGSGVGVSVAANKFPGVRAAVCHDSYSAHQGVEHDRMNVLCLGERIIGAELAKELTGIFLDAVFSDENRHIRRSHKIDDIEKEFLK